MAQKNPKWQWEQALIDAYYDHRWRQLLEPLCETLQRWKAGELTHADVDHAIEKAYQGKCLITNLFTQRRDRAVALIQWWDREWHSMAQQGGLSMPLASWKPTIVALTRLTAKEHRR